MADFNSWHSQQTRYTKRCITCRDYSGLNPDFLEAIALHRTGEPITYRMIFAFAQSKGYSLSESSLTRHLMKCLGFHPYIRPPWSGNSELQTMDRSAESSRDRTSTDPKAKGRSRPAAKGVGPSE